MIKHINCKIIIIKNRGGIKVGEDGQASVPDYLHILAGWCKSLPPKASK